MRSIHEAGVANHSAVSRMKHQARLHGNSSRRHSSSVAPTQSIVVVPSVNRQEEKPDAMTI